MLEREDIEDAEVPQHPSELRLHFGHRCSPAASLAWNVFVITGSRELPVGVSRRKFGPESGFVKRDPGYARPLNYDASSKAAKAWDRVAPNYRLLACRVRKGSRTSHFE